MQGEGDYEHKGLWSVLQSASCSVGITGPASCSNTAHVVKALTAFWPWLAAIAKRQGKVYIARFGLCAAPSGRPAEHAVTKLAAQSMYDFLLHAPGLHYTCRPQPLTPICPFTCTLLLYKVLYLAVSNKTRVY